MSEQQSVAVVTDSTADIPVRMVEEEGITLVRLITAFPNGDCIHDGDLTQAEFFDRMGQSNELPTTSQPPVGDFVRTYEQLLEKFDHVVSVHISSRLSGTIESARQAAARFGDRVHVFDSLNLSTAEGFQVIDAARTAKAGGTLTEVLAAAERTRSRVKHIVGLDRLDNLARGGRIGAVSALLGGLLDLKVLLTVDPDGAFQPVARKRGKKAALNETMEFVRRGMGDATKGRFFVAHAMSPETAESLRDRIAQAYETVEIHIVEAGSAITTHTGTGWGISFVPCE
jgi:DegV family protein with EDD domain